jgi:hypothetical protein
MPIYRSNGSKSPPAMFDSEAKARPEGTSAGPELAATYGLKHNKNLTCEILLFQCHTRSGIVGAATTHAHNGEATIKT